MKSVRFVKKTALAVLGLTVMMGASACTESASDHDMMGLSGTDNLFQQKNITDFQIQGSKKIVLTYDDGPTPKVTATILNTLRRHNVKATFFILAKNTVHKEVLKVVRDDGHTIANHSYSHDALNKHVYSTNPKMLLHQVVESAAVIKPFMNPAHTRYFRAPYGAWTASHAAKLNKLPQVNDYIGPVFWDIGGELTPRGKVPRSAAEITAAADWDCWGKGVSVEVCAAGYMKEIQRKKGGVILMHDVNFKTAQMSAIIIPKLIALGYEFITLDDLRSLEKYK